ncbi:unnamed protein product [Lactuca virosa]|uniref:Uncharacterized protein n=1 Tax=Lactuca virosa TaxID=75947 RepID=A0AAU9NNA1_9ASTR|nr:unnamed protein product [Lactuca virosa]
MENLPESETPFDVFVLTCEIGGVDVGDLRERMEDYVGRVKEMRILDEKAVEKEQEESILYTHTQHTPARRLSVSLSLSRKRFRSD